MAKDDEVKIIIKQKGTIPVYTSTRYGTGEVVHDETLEGKGTSSSPLKISDEILQEIEDAGKVDDVYVNGVSVLAEDKIAYVIVPTKVSELNNDLNFQTLTQVSNAISVHNESSTAHADIRQEIANVSDSIATSIATHNTSDSAHQDIRNLISDLSEWTTESYTATTTNFVVGQTYTIDGAFQRTAALFAGAFDEISTINSKIPAQATTQNQLADKAFVNSSIASSAANFRGNWLTWADVPTQASDYPVDYVGSTTPTNNDYLVVNDASDYVSGELTPIIRVQTVATHPSDAIINISDVLTGDVYEFHHRTTQTITPIGDTGFYVKYGGHAGTSNGWNITADRPFAVDGTVYVVGSEWFWTYDTTIDETADGYRVYSGSWRFVYSGTWSVEGKNGWYPAYRIGNAFTAEQQAAIDSKITLEMVENYVNPTSTANTAYNKRITALETDKRDIINSANKVYATDANGANKNDLVYTTVATADTIAQRGTNGVLKVGTPTEDADATTKLYVDTMASTKQNTLTAGTNISIVNDVISSTAQESFYRGKWSTWASVPSVSGDYPADYHGNHTPEQNDYMVVLDASGYVKEIGSVTENSVQGILNENDGNVSPNDTWRTSDFLSVAGDNTIDYTYTRIYTGNAGNRCCFYDNNKSFIRSASGPGTTGPGTYTYQVVAPANAVYVRFSYIKTDYDIVASYDSSSTLSGGWRFGYHGVWAEDNKNGWLPEYQIEDVLPEATDSVKGIAKLYNTTGANTDGSMTQGSITTALDGKQDTLTAGTNIDITNNVISATSVESFFRGKWNTWSNVPTDANLYPSDYKGSHIPTESDYMVVEDASGFVPGLDIELFIPQTGTRAFTLGGEKKTVPDYPDEVSWVLPDITITASFHNGIDSWFTANKTVKCDNVIYAAGDTFAKVQYYGNPGPTIYYSNSDSLSGAWRFSYRGTWATDNISGWKPEYQVEDVLPTADSATAGIAKLYTTTGNNTDGAIDQNGTTTAINTAVSTHNTASNAHSNIRGTANGLATLDANAKVPLTQMNDALVGNVSYQGLWNAETNDPFLPNPSGELPAGYTQYGWIKTVSGTPYIDTGISYDYANENEITVETKLNYLSTAGAGYASFGFTSGNGGMFIWKSWSGVPTVNVGGLTATLASETDTVVAMKVDKTLGQKSITIDGTTTYGAISSFDNLNIYVLSANNGGTPWSNQSYVKFYYVNISKGGTLLARLLPCKRNSDDAVGMYDTVRNTFYPVTSGVAEVGGSIEIPKGHYYITSVAGDQFNMHFEVGDWIISNGTSWTKVLNTDAVSSVEGRTGNVTVINDNASTGDTTYTWSADKLETEFGSLGTAAYTATTDYATAAQGAKADTALQPADVVEYTANEVETLWNSI